MIKDISHIPVLNYHKVTNQKDFGITRILPACFEKQINIILELGYTPITFKHLVRQHSLPEKPVIITFDDGYNCIYHHVLPLLLKYHVKVVIFIVTNYIGKVNSWEGISLQKKFRHLDRKEIRELHHFGCEIASHGQNHLPLAYYNRERWKKEILNSKKILEDILGDQVISFSYPYGLFNQEIINFVQHAGYFFAVANIYYRKLRNQYSSFALKRHSIYSIDNQFLFKKKLSPANGFNVISLSEWFIQKGSILSGIISYLKKN